MMIGTLIDLAVTNVKALSVHKHFHASHPTTHERMLICLAVQVIIQRKMLRLFSEH